jgi:hypothetical protein
VPDLRALHPFEAVWVVWFDGRAAMYFEKEGRKGGRRGWRGGGREGCLLPAR